MKLKNVKRLCGLLLAVVLVGSSSVQYAGVTKAATDEPSFSEATDNLLYNEETLSMEQGSKSFDVTVPENQTYYVSFTVKTAGEVYFDYRGSNARLYLGQTQYALLGLSDGALWPQGDIGLSTAVKITIQSDPDKTTLWINGEKAQEDKAIATTEAGTPKISWASTTTTFTNVQVWTVSDEPVYNAETDTLKYSSDTVTVPASSSYAFDSVEIPADQTYFGSFIVKATGNVYFNYRGNSGRILLGMKQCGFIGLSTEVWPQGDFGLAGTGVKITFRSDPDKTTIWVNGEKKAEDAALATTGEKGTPCVSWTDTVTTVENITFWTAKDSGEEEPPVSDEPVYNADTDKSYEITEVASGCTYTDGVLIVPVESGAGIKTGLPSNAVYYMTMQVQTENSVNIGTRSGSYINIQPSGYQLVNTTNDGWIESAAFANMKTTDGVRITVSSDTEGFKVWADGEKVIETQYSTKDLAAAPNITWSFSGQVTAKNIQIWTVSDEPKYNAATDKLYTIAGIDENGNFTVANESSATLTSELPKNASYYMSMNVKVGTDTTKTRYVGIGTRQSGKYIQLQSNGYTLVGIGDAGWENKELSNLMNDGIKITIYSSTERFIMWIDKEKIEDTTYVYGETDTKNAFPSIVWNQGGVTLSDIQIWTPPVAELKGSSVTLDGKIGLNIYAALNADAEMTKMNFTLPNGTVQESAGTLDPTTGYYKFTCKVAAKEMKDEIKAQVVAGDWMGEEYIYSVRNYADEILEDKAYEKAVPLVKAMLNYGAYAQKWFNYDTTNLANAGLTDTDVSSVTSDILIGFAKTQQINEAVGTLGGASLILESETSLKLYFKLAEGVTTDNCSFSLKSTESTESTNLEPVESSGYYYVVIDNIDAKSLDETYEVTVTSGENSLVASYSPMTYCYNVLKGSYDENLQNVVRALYLYNAAANNYFEPNN